LQPQSQPDTRLSMSEPWYRSFKNGVSVHVYDDQRYLETLFEDGTKVPACPQDNDKYRSQARQLGYGDDTWRMCKDHEMAHTVVCQAFGLPYSPTLWAVAHGHAQMIPGKPGWMTAEEDLVLAYQRWQLIRRG
jgi:hypothetical protein